MGALRSAALRLDEAGADDAVVLQRLWQLFRHDLSEFRDSWPGPDGLFPRRELFSYVAGNEDRVAYLFYTGEHLAGFATVAGLQQHLRTLDAFFVIRRARRLGLGQRAALSILGRSPGTWEIGFQENNVAAARFWRKIAALSAPSGWREESRPVPGKPWIPDDQFILFSTPNDSTLVART